MHVRNRTYLGRHRLNPLSIQNRLDTDTQVALGQLRLRLPR